MKVFVLNSKKLDIINLPQKVEGAFWINDADNNNSPAIMIEARNNNWILRSNENFKIYNGEEVIYDILLKNNTFYVVKNDSITKIIYVSVDVDNSFKLYKLSNGFEKLSIGSDSGSSIVFDSPYIGNRIITIVKRDSQFLIMKDKNDAVYVNSLASYGDTLYAKSGDQIFWFGLILYIFNENIFVNNPNNKVRINNNSLLGLSYRIIPSNYYPIKEIPLYKDDDYFVRAPRVRHFITTYEIVVSPPPHKSNEAETPIILLLGPMLTLAVTSSVTLLSLILRLNAGEVTMGQSWPQLVSSLAMIIASLLWPIATKTWQRNQKKKKEIDRVAKYTKYLEHKKKLLDAEIVKQSNILLENLLDLKSCYEIIMQKERILWERKISQKDFLTVRLGKGDVALDANISFNEEEFSMEEDELKKNASIIVQNAKTIKNMPVSFSFFGKNVTAVIGQENLLNSVVDNIFLQLIAYHGYDELKIVVFTDQENASYWEYLKVLPHSISNDKSIRFFATNSDEAHEVSDYLLNEYMMRVNDEASSLQNENADSGDSGKNVFSPYYLIFTDNYHFIRKLPIIEVLLKNKTNYGFGLFVRENRLRKIPSECENFINITQDSGAILSMAPSNSYEHFFVPEISNNYVMMDCSKVLANIPIEMESERKHLPDTIGFLQMYNVGRIEQLNILNRWRVNDPTKTLKSLIGIDESGEPIYLDLHEKKHGPHGLIAGTTGSGKSEFIITYILSLALNFSPNEVSFILIDYKGGGLAGAFANDANGIYLPHLAGVITNLDKNELNRTLVSIESELTRRQEKFNDAREQLGESTIDIYKYQKFYREGKLSEAIPHLFIICDEFAELKVQQPEFMDDLISAARIGRSLGVHLILATQKPSGVVNDQIISNTKFRVCLKVQSVADSNEVLKKPDAAMIKNAGRFYLQVGVDELYVLGQSGWTGVKYIPKDLSEEELDRSIEFVSNTLSTYKSVDNEKKDVVVKPLGDEITNILKYITVLANKENVRARKLWFESMPGVIYLSNLFKKYSIQANSDVVEAVIGEYDDPSTQSQNVLKLPLGQNGNTIIYGLSGIGKEMFIKSIIFSTSILYNTADINYYVIDFGSESLRTFGMLPQVADIVYSSNSEKIDKLFNLLLDEIEKRKELFADYNGEYNIYCENVKKIPVISLVINNFEAFRESYSNYDDVLNTIARDGKRYGIILIITASSSGGIFSKFLRSFDHSYVMDLRDSSEYVNYLGKKSNIIPALYEGRGLFKEEDIYEFQVASICENDKMYDYIKEVSKELVSRSNYVPKKIPILPEKVLLSSVINEISDLRSVPIGIEKESLNVGTFDFTTSKINLIASNELYQCFDFVNSFVRILKNIPNIVNVVVDSEDKFDNSNIKVNGYCNANFDKFLITLEQYLDKAIVNSKYSAVVTILGIDKFINSIDVNLFSKFISKYHNVDNVHFVLVDSAFNLKKYVFESWYTQNVMNTNGIWIGPNVSDQSAIKLVDLDKKYREKINDDYGWKIRNGNGTLVKLVKTDEVHNEK